MTFRCLTPSQFKGSCSSSSSSSESQRRGSLKERAPAFVSLSLPIGFELACFRLVPALLHETTVLLRTRLGGWSDYPEFGLEAVVLYRVPQEPYFLFISLCLKQTL